jgi:hypothetical protein
MHPLFLSFPNIGKRLLLLRSSQKYSQYIDPTGRVKVVPFDMDLEDYEIDILSHIEGTYQNNNLFYFIIILISAFNRA